MAVPMDTRLNPEPIPDEAPTPPPAPLSMPIQDLRCAPQTPAEDGGKDGAAARPRAWPSARVALARLIAVGGALGLTAYGYHQMTLVFGNETSTPLQILLLALFTLTFGWVAFSACQALAALVAPQPAPDTDEAASLTGRCAIIMPVYNEDPEATTARLFVMGEGLADAGQGEAFEIFILSDTTDPAIWLRETVAFAWLRAALAGRMRVWYRRRPRNTGRKSGNVADFVTRWGGRFDHMLVLDADSLMAPATILRMRRRMQAAPRLGILQTAPTPIGGRTLFALLQQFAGRLYGPVVARAVAAWQGQDGNYWGHNALIRVGAFAQTCGLPDLPGPRPFGGHILSHDFVEAALMRRGGWQVRMDPDLDGSWEGSPPSLADFATRDRRWAQGNLQHCRVIGARGLTLANRLHFFIGIASYLMSPLWLALLVTGAALTGQSLIYERAYFNDGPQLFPDWPVFDAERMIFLFGLSLLLLLLPKLAGVARALVLGEVRSLNGGAARILGGALVELVLSALFAPVLMLIQTRQLAEILMGRDSGWSAQRRDGALMTWREALSAHAWQMAFGVAPAALLLWLAPGLLVWLSPVLAGWLLAPVLSRASGTVPHGPVRRLLGLPETIEEPPIARSAEALRQRLKTIAPAGIVDLALNPEMRRAHVATLAGAAPHDDGDDPDEAARLARITARAKIEAAADIHQALGWLEREEAIALLSSANLLALLTSRLRPVSATGLGDAA